MASKAQIATMITGIADGDNNTAAEVRDVLNAMNEGSSSSEVFEYFSKNIGSFPMTNTYDGGELISNTFTTPNGDVIKTYSYDGDGDLDTITFSGVGYPTGVPTIKTFGYDGSKNVLSATYS